MADGSGQSRFTARVRRALTAIREARALGVPVDEVVGQLEAREPRGVTRRTFLGATAGVAGGLAWESLPYAWSAIEESRPGVEHIGVVVVGGGLAGLRFAQKMWARNGIRTTVFEASSRLGGRVWSDRGGLAGGPVIEHGGELISDDHSSMLGLVRRYGLALEAFAGGSAAKGDDVIWLDGREYRSDEFARDLAEIQPALDEARAAAGSPPTFASHSPGAKRLAGMSVADWLAQNVPGGQESRLSRVLRTSMVTEFGFEPVAQSALNLIEQFGGRPGKREPGGSIRYRVAGGADLVVKGLVSELPSRALRLGHVLVGLARLADGRCRCTFQLEGSGTREVIADHVVLAVPFPKLREVDLRQARLSDRKVLAINRLSLGTAAKVTHLFSAPVWNGRGNPGGSLIGGPFEFQQVWEAAPHSGRALLTNVLGGAAASPVSALTDRNVAHGPARPDVAAQFLALLRRDSRIPGPVKGLDAAYTGRSWVDQWAKDPFIGGAYSSYKPDEHIQFAGVEQLREGAIHFCGEHTSVDFKGSMEGAVRSAERLAAHWPSL